MADRDLVTVSELGDGTPVNPPVVVSVREMAGRDGQDVVGPGDTAEVTYLCKGSDDPLICRQGLLDSTLYLINNYDGLVLKTLARQRLSNEAWRFVCAYGNVPEPDGYVVSIDTSGGQFLRTEALFPNAQFPRSGFNMSDFGSAINVDNGEVKGVDVVGGALKLNVVAKVLAANIGDPIAYAKTISNLTGKVNSATYLGFDPGELLFTGASGEVITNGDPTLTFSFEARPNQTNLTVGPVSGISAGGHEYVWMEYITQADTVGADGRAVQQAIGANVSVVYQSVSFAALGIGGA